MAEKPAASTSLWDKLHEMFGIDLRSMALYRVLLGILLLGEIVARLVDVRAFYTDDGIAPQSIIPADIPISLHMMDGSLNWQLILFAVQAIFAVMLLIGWQTRLAIVVSWFLLISLQGRNTIVQHNGDVFLRMSMFFAMFLPLGAMWSVDSRFRPRPKGVGPLFLNAGTIAYVSQICIVYIFAVLWKSAPEWRTEFSAVHYALYIDTLASPLARLIRQSESLMTALTVATMIIEASAPLLLLFPFGTQWTRLLAVFLFMGLHAGFAACLVLGNFAPVCWVGWCILLPPLFWDLLSRWCRRPSREGVTLFTRRPESETGRLQSLRQFLLLPQLTILTESSSGKGPVVSSGWWLHDATDREDRVGGAALRHLLWLSPLWWPLAWVPARALGGMARWVGGVSPPAPEASDYRQRYLTPYTGPVLATLVLFCLAYTLAWNIRGLYPEQMANVFPRQMSGLGNTLALDQGWGVFAPAPGRFHGWYVMVATFADGTQLDLVQNREPDFERRPDEVWRTYINSRWRRVFQGMVDPAFQTVVPYYADWVRREWNRGHPENKMLVLEIYFMATPTTREGLSEPQKMPLYRLSVREEDR